MKRINFINLIFLSLILLFSITSLVLDMGVSRDAYANDQKVFESISDVTDLNRETIISKSKQEIARSGCCSWHGGVCDCIGGRVLCCDGTFSPTCTCHHNSNKEVIDSKE